MRIETLCPRLTSDCKLIHTLFHVLNALVNSDLRVRKNKIREKETGQRAKKSVDIAADMDGLARSTSACDGVQYRLSLLSFGAI
jgi:hypothetical protein